MWNWSVFSSTIAPEAHEVVFVDEFTARLDENFKDLEGTTSQRNRGSARPQFTPS
jgi:hypothetical protein